jgi:hypothetical protein
MKEKREKKGATFISQFRGRRKSVKSKKET